MSATFQWEEQVRRNVALAPYTTFKVGGRAQYFAEVSNGAELVASLTEARQRRLPVTVLGGGSNVLIADAGIRGLVLRYTARRLRFHADGGATLVIADGAVPWDRVVRLSVARGLRGIECLSGIPGFAGGAPVQNIGAYGQELSSVVTWVEAIHVATGQRRRFRAAECRFAYRTSYFKTAAGAHYVITSIALRLKAARNGRVRYGELSEALHGRVAPLATIRRTVLRLRRRKAMLIESQPDAMRSVGSFFANPVVSQRIAARVIKRALAKGYGTPKTWPVEGGRIKFAAAWLIERSGYPKGYRDGAVGLSPRHTLAIINIRQAKARDVLRLARRIRRHIVKEFGITLEVEPVFLGFTRPPSRLLTR